MCERTIIKIDGHIFTKHSTNSHEESIKQVIRHINNATETFDIYVNLDKIKPYHFDITFIKDFIQLFQQVYPNRLHKCYVIGCSAMCRTVYDNIRPFIEKRLQRKIEFETKLGEDPLLCRS